MSSTQLPEAEIRRLETPRVLVDVDTLTRNLEIMAEVAKDNGVGLRPHIKTHKTTEIARMQVDRGATGLTVAKLGEAEVMAEAGFRDLFIANEIIGPQSRLERLAALAQRTQLTIGVDSPEGARALNDVASRLDVQFRVRAEINTGLDRAGVLPEQSLRLAAQLGDLSNLNLVGIFTHSGYYVQGVEDAEWRAGVHEREAGVMVRVADELISSGYEITEVSVGSTPTSRYAAEIRGITEIRPGTYVFQDATQVRLGRCAERNCALSVLTSVVSKPSPDRAIIDAGSKVFSSDRGHGFTPELGYGIVKGHSVVVLDRMWEEHGRLLLHGDEDVNIGDVLEIVPVHACPVVNLTDRLLRHKGGVVEGEWAVVARGRVI